MRRGRGIEIERIYQEYLQRRRPDTNAFFGDVNLPMPGR